MIDGITSDPFSAATLPPLFEDYRTDNLEKVVMVSRERYANSREVVEDKINRWSGSDLSEKMMEAVGGRDERSARDNRGSSGAFSRSTDGSRPRPVEVKPRSESVFAHHAQAQNPSQSQSGPFPKKTVSPKADQPLATSPSFTNNKKDNSEGVRVSPAFPKKTDKPVYLATCSICGKESQFNFKPDGSRPVICKDCLTKMQRGEKIDGLEEVPSEFKKTLNPPAGGEIRLPKILDKKPEKILPKERPMDSQVVIPVKKNENNNTTSLPMATPEVKPISLESLKNQSRREERPINKPNFDQRNYQNPDPPRNEGCHGGCESPCRR